MSRLLIRTPFRFLKCLETARCPLIQAALLFLFRASAFLRQGSAWHILPGVMVSWISLFSWLAVFRHFGVTNPLLFWMPLGPAAITAFAAYLFTSQKRLEAEVEELDRARYNLKGA